VSRTLQEQLSLILKPQVASEAPERPKSELRRMADRAGFDPDIRELLNRAAGGSE
jgi:hypothetical protein